MYLFFNFICFGYIKNLYCFFWGINIKRIVKFINILFFSKRIFSNVIIWVGFWRIGIVRVEGIYGGV